MCFSLPSPSDGPTWNGNGPNRTNRTPSRPQARRRRIGKHENKDDGEGGAENKTTSPYRDINFELWTQKFVGAVGNLDALLLDAFLPNETFANRVELYPNKLLNLQRRSLLVGSITYVPYTITNYVVSNCRLSLYLSFVVAYAALREIAFVSYRQSSKPRIKK